MKTYNEVLEMRRQSNARYDAMLEEAQTSALQNAITLEDILNVPLESSSSVTSEYRAVVRKANARMKKILATTGWKLLPRNSMPHFEYSVQLQHESGKMAHFFTGDLRGMSRAYGWVVRSVKDANDWTGGSNRSVSSEDALVRELQAIAQ